MEKEELNRLSEDHAEGFAWFAKWVYKQAFTHGFKHGVEENER